MCFDLVCFDLRFGIGELTVYSVPTQIAFSHSRCFPCSFPVRRQFFPVPINVNCEYFIHKTDLADLSVFKKDFFIYIFYRKSQGIYNLSKPNSLCFGKISKFPVFFLTEFFGPFSLFSLCNGYPGQRLFFSCSRLLLLFIVM